METAVLIMKLFATANLELAPEDAERVPIIITTASATLIARLMATAVPIMRPLAAQGEVPQKIPAQVDAETVPTMLTPVNATHIVKLMAIVAPITNPHAKGEAPVVEVAAEPEVHAQNNLSPTKKSWTHPTSCGFWTSTVQPRVTSLPTNKPKLPIHQHKITQPNPSSAMSIKTCS